MCRETCQRKRYQTNRRKYQRSWRKRKIDRLTKRYQYPATVNCIWSPIGTAYHVADLHRDVPLPNPVTPDDRESEQQHFREHRISHTHGRGDETLKLRLIFGIDDAPIEELPDSHLDPPMHNHLGSKKERHAQEQPGVRPDVEEKWDTKPAHGVARQDRQHEKGHPGDERNHDDPTCKQVGGRLQQSGPQEKLEERSPLHQREIGRLVEIGDCLTHPVQSPRYFTRLCSVDQLDLTRRRGLCRPVGLSQPWAVPPEDEQAHRSTIRQLRQPALPRPAKARGVPKGRTDGEKCATLFI